MWFVWRYSWNLSHLKQKLSITISVVTTNSIQSCILTRKLFFQMACVGYFQLFSWTIVYLSIAAKNLSTQAFKQCSIHKRLPLPLLCLKVKHRPFTFSTSPQALYLPHCLLELYSQSITSRNDDDRVENMFSIMIALIGKETT